MSKVRLEISMPLDGYATASGIRPDEPMGDGGRNSTNGPSAVTSEAAPFSPKARAGPVPVSRVGAHATCPSRGGARMGPGSGPDPDVHRLAPYA